MKFLVLLLFSHSYLFYNYIPLGLIIFRIYIKSLNYINLIYEKQVLDVHI